MATSKRNVSMGGISSGGNSGIGITNYSHSNTSSSTMNTNTTTTNSAAAAAPAAPAKDQTRLRIERMEAEREERRRIFQERKQERVEEELRLLAAGNTGDVDFIGMVQKWREDHEHAMKPYQVRHGQQQTQTHITGGGGIGIMEGGINNNNNTNEDTMDSRISICVRKRPINSKERKKKDHDSVTCLNPVVWVHGAKFRVDGISKYLDHNAFCFDNAFDEDVSTEDVYRYSTLHLVDFICSGIGGRATVFAYGQTGSGKTHTMSGIQTLVAEDIFMVLSGIHSNGTESGDACTLTNTFVSVSFFEIYGGGVQDLLNDCKRLRILEDGKGEVVVTGLEEYEANTPDQLLNLMDTAQRKRTTHATEANDTSSRSHAICQIILRDKATSKLRGKLSLVDLAGSERGSDTKSHDRQRRTESSEINTSLLALKECIRALDSGKGNPKHVPYRASKLTLILKDCFTSNSARTTMIATVSPGVSSTDHTLNTLRYADRIKEKKVEGFPIDAKHDDLLTVKKITSIDTINLKQPMSSHEFNDFSEFKEDDDLETILNSTFENASTHETYDRQADMVLFHRTVKSIFEEEEALLNLHMSVIQENAELLTEEGNLLRKIEKSDVSVDDYASRLGAILDRKTGLINEMKDKISSFRSQLRREEELSRKIAEYNTLELDN